MSWYTVPPVILGQSVGSYRRWTNENIAEVVQGDIRQRYFVSFGPGGNPTQLFKPLRHFEIPNDTLLIFTRRCCTLASTALYAGPHPA
jgi:hypothetical protein